MDPALQKIMETKIDEVIRGSGEILAITKSLQSLISDEEEKVAFGIALGRVYNSFHYQTRRVLKRNATEQEFSEFVVILAKRAGEIKEALRLGRQRLDGDDSAIPGKELTG
ncbi:MAG: hypothetical protein ACE5JV_00295 [Nitrososphaerales archaeon]